MSLKNIIMGAKYNPERLRIYDVVINFPASQQNLSVSGSPLNYNSTNITLPPLASIIGKVTPSTPSNSIFTYEMWRRQDTSPTALDLAFQVGLYGADPQVAVNYISVFMAGQILGTWNATNFNTSMAFSATANQWHHIAIVIKPTAPSQSFAIGVDGVFKIKVDNSAYGSWSGPANTIRFKHGDALSAAFAQGWADDIRVSNGDIYNLLNSSNYTKPTAPLTVVNGVTTNLFRGVVTPF